MVANGCIDVNAEPTRISKPAALERWNGNLGPGNLNAHFAMSRAIALSHQFGIGCVALANTNHWMRGGSYGWLAADEGVFGMCWTNTLANLPPWGASTPALGNNPLAIAIHDSTAPMSCSTSPCPVLLRSALRLRRPRPATLRPRRL